MKKLLILIIASIFSVGVWATNPSYDYCNTVNMNELDNVERSECSGVLKTTNQKEMNLLLQKVISSKSLDPKDKTVIQESQKAFVNYMNKQCSLFVNNGASADGLINKELCEVVLIDQRNQVLETMVD